MTGTRVLLPVLLMLAFLGGCATPPAPVEPVIENPMAQPQPDVTPAPEPAPEPEKAPEPPPTPEPEGPIEVSQDVYNRAFAEVEAVIDQLNDIISRGQFDVWKTFLTQQYITYYSDQRVLAEISSQPILLQNNIKVRSLHDYFQNVVAPSRAHVRLDDLIFYSDTLVEAVTNFRGQKVILYLLRKIDGAWKIDTRETLPANDTSTDAPASPGGDGLE